MEELIPNEVIMNKIYLIRGQKVMIDSDLAKLYQVETKQLNRAVKRNSKRFPERVMFQLTPKEAEVMQYQIGTASSKRNTGNPPYAFTEHGVLQLSSVLNSEVAIAISWKIIDVFVSLREALADNTNMLKDIESLKRIVLAHDKTQKEILGCLDQLIEKAGNPPREKIGYKNKN